MRDLGMAIVVAALLVASPRAAAAQVVPMPERDRRLHVCLDAGDPQCVARVLDGQPLTQGDVRRLMRQHHPSDRGGSCRTAIAIVDFAIPAIRSMIRQWVAAQCADLHTP